MRPVGRREPEALTVRRARVDRPASWGDRAQTVTALAAVLPQLQDEGLRFVVL